MMKKVCAVLTVSALCLAGLTQAGVVTLGAAADSYIRSSQAGTNFGTATFMVSNNATANGIRWSFVRFDLSGITDTITGLELEIQAEKAGNNWPVTLSFDVYGLTTGEGWTESGTGGLNWTNAPARNGNAVDLAGVYSGGAISTFDYKGVVSGNTGGPVVAAIDQAAGGAAVNFINADSDKIVTFIIARKYDDAANTSGAAWATKEKTYSDVAAPILTVYTVPEPATLVLLGLGGLILGKRK